MELDRTQIEHALPAEPGAANWNDVLQRADRARRRQARRTAAVVAVVALLAVVASAFGGRIVRLFEGQPAPPSVQRSARDMLPPDPIQELMGRQSPRVAADQTRGLIRLDTDAGPFFLWGAPTTNGGRCIILTFGNPGAGEPVSSGACVTDTSAHPEFALGNDVGFPGVGKTLVEYGIVPRASASAELTTTGGDKLPLQLVEGTFAVQLPSGTKLREIAAYDASGGTVKRESLVFHRPTCCKVAVAPNSTYKPLFSIQTSIGTVTLKTAVGYPLCYQVDLPADEGHSSGMGTCRSAGPLPTLVQLGVGPLTSDYSTGPVLISGSARDDIRQLALRFTDGTTLPLPLHDTYFMAEIAHGKHPTVFVAQLANGKTVQQSFAPEPPATPRR